MKYIKKFNALNSNDIVSTFQALCDSYDFNLAFNTKKDRAVSSSNAKFIIDSKYTAELHRLNSKIKKMNYSISATANIKSDNLVFIKSDVNLDNLIGELNSNIGATNIRTIIRLRKVSAKRTEHDEVFDNILEVVSGIMNYDLLESEEGYTIAILSDSGNIIGTIDYHSIPSTNPFYQGYETEYPENKYVIEINSAEENVDTGELDLDDIRLIPVINGKFDTERLVSYLED